MNDKFDYVLTNEQAKDICDAVGVDIKSMETWEVGELIDKFISDAIERLMN